MYWLPLIGRTIIAKQDPRAIQLFSRGGVHAQNPEESAHLDQAHASWLLSGGTANRVITGTWLTGWSHPESTVSSAEPLSIRPLADPNHNNGYSLLGMVRRDHWRVGQWGLRVECQLAKSGGF